MPINKVTIEDLKALSLPELYAVPKFLAITNLKK
jgi:hypothetical protein